MVSERSRNGHSEEPVCKSQTTYTPYRLTILAAMVLTAGAGCAGEAKITKIDRGVIVQTYRYQVQVRDGAVVGILNRLTGEEYVSARAIRPGCCRTCPAAWARRMAKARRPPQNSSRSPGGNTMPSPCGPTSITPRPTARSRFEQAKGRPGVAVVTYKGLTDGSKTYDDETFSLEVRVDGDTGDLLLTSSVQSPRKGVYGCGVTVAPLAPAVTVEAPIFDGVRLDANMKPGLWVNRWASYWDYAFVALNGKDKGTVRPVVPGRRIEVLQAPVLPHRRPGAQPGAEFDERSAVRRPDAVPGRHLAASGVRQKLGAGGREVPQLAKQER